MLTLSLLATINTKVFNTLVVKGPFVTLRIYVYIKEFACPPPEILLALHRRARARGHQGRGGGAGGWDKAGNKAAVGLLDLDAG